MRDNYAAQLLSELLKREITISTWLATMGVDRSLFYKFVKGERTPGKLYQLKLLCLLSTLRGDSISEKIIPLLWENNEVVQQSIFQRVMRND